MEFLFVCDHATCFGLGRVTSGVGKRICDGRQQALASRRNRDHEGESQVRHVEAMTSARMWNQTVRDVTVNRWSVDCLPKTAHASASNSTRSANRAGCSS